MSQELTTRQQIENAFKKGYQIAKRVGYAYTLDNHEVDYQLPGDIQNVTEVWFIKLPEPPEDMHPAMFLEEVWRFDTYMKNMASIPEGAICVQNRQDLMRLVFESTNKSFQITEANAFFTKK